MDKQFFTTSEAADYLGVSVSTIRNYMYRKGLKYATNGGRGRYKKCLINKSDLDEYLNTLYKRGVTSPDIVNNRKEITPLQRKLNKLVGKWFIKNLNYVKVTGYDITDNTILIYTNKRNYCLLAEAIDDELDNFLPIEN